MSFADRIARYRQRLGWTQQQLAAAVGVSTTCVWNWERGNTFPRQASVQRLAKRLGIDPAELVGDYSTPSERARQEPIERPSERSDPQSIDEVLERAKDQISALLNLPRERIQLSVTVGA